MHSISEAFPEIDSLVRGGPAARILEHAPANTS